ncbi:hypothetical protein UR09_04315 [Candidatus Nitromaritima sp. SCGC AAA799-A02]|nr:hypothetical protein UR09_04315 [Candidatus Nitromaritima sp. SCGC AAA799-A02]
MELVSESVDISSPPQIYIEVNRVVNDPNSSFMKIADTIRKDFSLSARLLKIANGPFYNFPSKIETIVQAISIIGTQQLVDLVLATSVLKKFKNIPRELMSMDSFWRHSIACGIIARTIAIYRHEANVERFYIMGLLHDIGQLIILEKVPDLARRALNQRILDQNLLHETERKVIGFDHAAVGGALMKAWELPLNIEEAVAFHHAPLKAAHYPVETAIVHLSDIIANAMRRSASNESCVASLEMEAWNQTGIPVSLLPSIWKRADLMFNEMVKTFIKD